MIRRLVLGIAVLSLAVLYLGGAATAASYVEEFALVDGLVSVGFNQSLGTLDRVLIDVSGRCNYGYSYRNISLNAVMLQATVHLTSQLDLPWHPAWSSGTVNGDGQLTIAPGHTSSFGGALGYSEAYDSDEDSLWASNGSFTAQILTTLTSTLIAKDASGGLLDPAAVCELVSSSSSSTGSATITYYYTPVPEPASVLALLCGVGGLAACARRRRTA